MQGAQCRCLAPAGAFMLLVPVSLAWLSRPTMPYPGSASLAKAAGGGCGLGHCPLSRHSGWWTGAVMARSTPAEDFDLSGIPGVLLHPPPLLSPPYPPHLGALSLCTPRPTWLGARETWATGYLRAWALPVVGGRWHSGPFQTHFQNL